MQAEIEEAGRYEKIGQNFKRATKPYMSENTQENILKKAGEMFYRAGIKSVSVDDICKELGMSKKTFYVYFEGKDDLVKQMLRKSHETIHQKSLKTMQEHSLVELMRGFAEQARNQQDVRHVPQLVYDLQKYYPLLFADYQRHVFQDQQEVLKEYLQKGIDEGTFRKETNVDTVAFMLAKMHSDVIRDAEMLEKNGIAINELSRESMDIIVRGLLSKEGYEQVYGG